MMVEQSLTLVLVMVWLFTRMLTRSEQEELRRERLGGCSSFLVERRHHHRVRPPDDNFTWSTQQLTGFLAAVSSAEDGADGEPGGRRAGRQGARR